MIYLLSKPNDLVNLSSCLPIYIPHPLLHIIHSSIHSFIHIMIFPFPFSLSPLLSLTPQYPLIQCHNEMRP
jgi:hypothetical protein